MGFFIPGFLRKGISMKNVDIVALGTTLREELEFCKKNGIKNVLNHMVDAWYVDVARLETVKGFTVLSARYAYKFFNITICYEGGYYVAYDADIEEGDIKVKKYKSKNLNVLLIGLLIHFKMSI